MKEQLHRWLAGLHPRLRRPLVFVIGMALLVVLALLIEFTDVTLQLDNAVAISSVASQVPARYRPFVIGGGVLLAATCLLAFTLVGSTLIERFGWLKLVLIGIKLAFDYFTSR
jgi:predicted tellurium resistance membrane protein TerC